MNFCCRKYLTRAFWVASYTVVFQNKQTNKMLHRKKISPIYLLLMLPSLNAYSKQVSVGNKFTLNVLLSQKVVCIIWNGHANVFNLSLTECTKGAFLSQRVDGKLTVVIGVMSSLPSSVRSSSGMSGSSTRTQSKCAIGDTSQPCSGRLAWCGRERDCLALGFS